MRQYRHGSLGENLKVHFAGAENYEFAYILHDAGVNYFLFTVFPFICEQFGIKSPAFSNCKNVVPIRDLPEIANHVIMDSGLFSLMFGAYKHVKPDEKFIRDWKDAIVRYVKDNQAWNITCVECDCQKLLGTDLAWELRKEMRTQLPDNKIINVFHFEDGKAGLESLIDFSDYIAVSVPELRIVKPKTYREDVYALVSHIKERKPEIDIHLLGCTQEDILRRCSFCTTSDSTSWLQINKFGSFMGRRKSDVKKEKIDEDFPHVKKLLIHLGIEPTESKVYYYYWLVADLLKRKYTEWVGNQD